MNILIDTNIIRKDLKLRDRNFDILLDYLSKTNSIVILPQIVTEEIAGLYKRLVSDRKDDYDNALRKLNSVLLESNFDNEVVISIDSEVNSYIKYLKSKLKIQNNNIIRYKAEYLNDIVRRAIEKRKPCGKDGQHFRDAILWLTLLDYTKTLPERKIVFISDNPKDFGSGDTSELDPQLKAEANSLNIEIFYYRTISDFVKQHAVKIDFITRDWIIENVSETTIEKMFNEIIEKDDRVVLDIISDSLEYGKEPTGYIQPLDYICTNLIDFYVYEMQDGTFLLNLEYEIEKEYEYEFEEEVEREKPDCDYDYHFNPSTRSYELEYIHVPRLRTEYEAKCQCSCPLFRAKYIITIKDRHVVDYDFKEWELG